LGFSSQHLFSALRTLEVCDHPDPFLGPVEEVALLRDAQRCSLVARNARQDGSILEAPAVHRSWMAQAAVGENPGESAETLKRLAGDQNQSMRKAARGSMDWCMD